MRPPILLWYLAAITSAPAVAAQKPTAATMDSLLQHLVGDWDMAGTVRGRPVSYRLEGRRALQNRFIELRMEDRTQPPGYEARVFFGVDSTGHRCIVHWLDNTGAAFSIPDATGGARGDTVLFTFAYADGPFRDTFAYDRGRDVWHFRLESGDSTGRWRLFADYQVHRR